MEQLSLQPHPEGGWYRELHRSDVRVQREDGEVRCAFTQILFLLPAGGISRWHRVRGADETWQFLGGAPLQLWQLPPAGGLATAIWLGPFALAVVPSNCWQAAHSPHGWSLLSCCVAPGFEFKDFELLSDLAQEQHPAGAQAQWL
ncbi:MAG: cupin domain-containing protein [Prochlorococcaceae cyanobacterium]